MIEAAWDLGYRWWAHHLGRGGHFLTKFRKFSITFGHLRGERIAYRKVHRHPDGELDPWGRPLDESVVLLVGSWHYAGSGYQASDAHLLALMAADSARDHALPGGRRVGATAPR